MQPGSFILEKSSGNRQFKESFTERNRRLSKLIFILTVTLLLAGCSLPRRTQTDIIGGTGIQTIKQIGDKNLTSRNFFIQKADIRIITEERSNSLIASLKYNTEGVYLASIRAKSGLEILRVYLSGDTILANDRMHRRLYYGSASILKEKYGISLISLPVLLGDILIDKNMEKNEIICTSGDETTLIVKIPGEVIQKIDCKAGKLKIAEIRENEEENLLKILYDDFVKTGDFVYPGNISIQDNVGSKIIIQIKKVTFDFSDTIAFNAGAGYEKVLIK